MGKRPADPEGNAALAALLESGLDHQCPLCGKPPESGGIDVATWECKGVRRGRRVFHARTTRMPGLCRSCHDSLLGKRVVAAALAVAPIPLLYGGLRYAGRAEPGLSAVLGVLLLLYAAYFLRRVRYGWGDSLVYGWGLHAKVAPHVAAGAEGVHRVRLPVPWLHAMGRVGAAVAAVGIVLMLPMSGASEDPLPVAAADAAESPDPGGPVEVGPEAPPATHRLLVLLKEDDLRGVEALLDSHPGLLREEHEESGAMWLHFATSSLALTRLLLDRGAAIDAVDSPGGNTALHCAVQRRERAIVRLLVERGADPSIRNDVGETPLDVARRGGFSEIVEILEGR